MFLNSLLEAMCDGDGEPKHTIDVFLDLKKAFDTVRHYLQDRKQYVVIDGVTFNEATMSCGVPQGSVLGPLLFLFFINDAPRGFRYLLTILFADDTTLQMSNQDAKTLFEKVNSALALVSDWFRADKLTLHPSKTK